MVYGKLNSNHMWFEFVKPDMVVAAGFKAPRTQVINDFIFLLVFGLLGMAICYSRDLNHFLNLNAFFAAVGLAWIGVYAAVTRARAWLKRTSPIPAGPWQHFAWVNLVQLMAVMVTKCYVLPLGLGPVQWWPEFLPAPAWDWSLVSLVLVYFGLLVFDLWKQLTILEAA